MDEKEEAAYNLGRKAVLREQLGNILRGLGDESTKRDELFLERAEAIAALRSACGDHGDNDWDDNLHLSDIINKHLVNYLLWFG